MVGLVEAVFLGIVQGLTEWLPVSSFGHLVIVQKLLGLQVPLIFDIALHGGTIVAVFVFFWKEIMDILSAVLRLDFRSGNGRMALLVLVGSVPVALVGFLLYDALVPIFDSLLVVGASLVVTGFILYSTKFFSGEGTREEERERDIGFKDSLVIGISQAASILPGLSRSGLTISSALFRKIGKRQAFAFSFLLAIPAIVGANLFELYKDAGSEGVAAVGIETLLGAATAAIVGYASLKVLDDILERGRFHMFAYYCWFAGAAVLVYSLL